MHDGDAEAVHQVRVSARRLRSELSALASVLPEVPWSEFTKDLAWVGKTLGEWRDLHVVEGHLMRVGDDLPELHSRARAEGERRLARAQRNAITMFDSPRYERVIRRLAKLSKDSGLAVVGERDALPILSPLLWRAACRYLDEVGDPTLRRGDEELHRVRIATKRCRYNFELAGLYWGEPPRAVAEELAKVQEVLGDVQDRVVAIAFVDSLELGDVDEPVRRRLREEIAEIRPEWREHYRRARELMTEVFGAEFP